MAVRLKLTLEQTEYSALIKLAVAELRNAPDQARHVLRQELIRRGLLPIDAPAINSGAAQPLAAEMWGGQNVGAN